MHPLLFFIYIMAASWCIFAPMYRVIGQDWEDDLLGAFISAAGTAFVIILIVGTVGDPNTTALWYGN